MVCADCCRGGAATAGAGQGADSSRAGGVRAGPGVWSSCWDLSPLHSCDLAPTRPFHRLPRCPDDGQAPFPWGGRASPLHTGIPDDHSATLSLQVQVRSPDPTIWWPAGQRNTMTVPTAVPSPRRTWSVPLGGGCTWVHVPREKEGTDSVRVLPSGDGHRCPNGHMVSGGHPAHQEWQPQRQWPGDTCGADPDVKGTPCSEDHSAEETHEHVPPR